MLHDGLGAGAVVAGVADRVGQVRHAPIGRAVPRRQRLAGVVVPVAVVAGREKDVAVLIAVHLHGETHLAQVRHALGPVRLGPRLGQRGEQDRHQQADDSDHHQQLDEGETGTKPTRATVATGVAATTGQHGQITPSAERQLHGARQPKNLVDPTLP